MNASNDSSFMDYIPGTNTSASGGSTSESGFVHTLTGTMTALYRSTMENNTAQYIPTIVEDYFETYAYLFNVSTQGNYTNISNVQNGEQQWMHRVFSMRFIPYTLLAAGGCGFNILSLLAITHIRGHRSVYHTLLLNLAACDILGSGLLWTYFNSPHLYPQFSLSTLGHCLFIFIGLVMPFILSLCSSSLSLLILAGNQYLAICDPLFAATKVTHRTASFLILSVWGISILAAVVPSSFMLVKTRDDNCTIYVEELGVKSLEICSYALVAVIIVIVSLYARIYREIVQFRRRTPQLRNAAHIRARRGDDKEHNYKAFITTLLLSGTLLIFWLPFLTFHFITAHINVENMSDLVLYMKLYLIDFLPMVNYITNPIIYGIRMKEIRESYHRLFSKLMPCCIKSPNPPIRGSVRFSAVDSTNV